MRALRPDGTIVLTADDIDPRPSAMTPAMKSALKWLLNRGGDGVFGEKSNRSVLLAMGDRAPVMRGTWSKLERVGMVERYDRLRLRATGAGRAANLADVDESREY